MVTDFLRSAYSTYVDFGDGNPVLVCWYEVPCDTQHLPFPSAFVSRNWETYREWLDEPGEINAAPRPWRNGSRCRSCPTGTPIGTPEQWSLGITPGTPYVRVVAPGVPEGTDRNIAGCAQGIVSVRWGVSARSRSRSRVAGRFGVRYRVRAAEYPDVELFGSVGSVGSVDAIFAASAAATGVAPAQQSVVGLTYSPATSAASFAGQSAVVGVTASGGSLAGFSRSSWSVDASFAAVHSLAGSIGVADGADALTVASASVAGQVGTDNAVLGPSSFWHSLDGAAGVQYAPESQSSGAAELAGQVGVENACSSSSHAGRQWVGNAGVYYTPVATTAGPAQASGRVGTQNDTDSVFLSLHGLDGGVAAKNAVDAILSENVTTFQCAAISAAGSTQGTATAITSDNVNVTTVGAGQGVILPAGCYRVTVRNSGANTLKVYPPSGAALGPNGTNNAANVNVGSGLLCVQISSTIWMLSSLT